MGKTVKEILQEQIELLEQSIIHWAIVVEWNLTKYQKAKVMIPYKGTMIDVSEMDGNCTLCDHVQSKCDRCCMYGHWPDGVDTCFSTYSAFNSWIDAKDDDERFYWAELMQDSMIKRQQQLRRDLADIEREDEALEIEWDARREWFDNYLGAVIEACPYVGAYFKEFVGDNIRRMHFIDCSFDFARSPFTFDYLHKIKDIAKEGVPAPPRVSVYPKD
jgi:hypothetical protein